MSEGFLIVRMTYRVRCLQCGFRGKANLGKEPIQSAEADAADYCPACGALALVGDNRRETDE